MRYYWEALFSAEYFPYWEFTMLMMLALQLSHLWRVHRIEREMKEVKREMKEVISLANMIMDEVEE